MNPLVTFDVIVEQSFSDANAFGYDETARAIRLDGVMRVSDLTWANRGYIFASATPRGEPLRAFLISDLPIAPNVRVEACAVGALEWTRGAMIERVIVAVPIADERYASAHSFNDLPAPHRAAIQRMLEESARWLDANSAEELIRLARQRARLAQVEQREHERARPAWKADSSRALIDRLARETDLHTQAESTLFLAPYRFQQYLRLCLNPEERILFWVHRPRFTVNRATWIKGRALRERLLLATDQQLLWMVDPVTPSPGVEGYGYVARTVAPEMMCKMEIEEKLEHFILRLTSENALGERGDFEIEFSLTARDELEQAARLVGLFVPRRDESRLRRVPSARVMPIQFDDPMESDREKTRVVVDELQKILAEGLGDETIYAQALVPAWAEGGPKLLTVTNQNLYITSRSRHTNHAAHCLRAVIAPEICFSVLGSWLKLNFPQAKSLQIAFPPTAFKTFNACWHAIRKLCV